MGKKIKWRFVLLIASAFLLSFVVSYVSQTNAALKACESLISQKIDAAAQVIERNEQHTESALELIRETSATKAKAALECLDTEGKYDTDAALKELCKELYVDEINIFDKNGEVIRTTVPEFMGFKLNSSDQSSFFLPLLEGKTDVMVQEPMYIGFDHSSVRQYAAVYDEKTGGIIQIGCTPDAYSKIQNLSDISNMGEVLTIGNDGVITIVRSNTVVSSADKDKIGTPSMSLFSDERNVLGCENLTSARSDGKTHFKMSDVCGEYTIIGAVPETEVFEQRNSMLIQIVIFNTILFGVILIAVSVAFGDAVMKRLSGEAEKTVPEEKLPVFTDNEYRANEFSAVGLLFVAALYMACWILNTAGVFDIKQSIFNRMMLLTEPLMILPYLLVKGFRLRGKYMKYIIVFTTVLAVCICDATIGEFSYFLLVLPLLTSCHYYSKRLTYTTLAVSAAGLVISTFIGVFIAGPDLNYAQFVDNEAVISRSTLLNTMIFLLPTKIISLCALTPICATISTRTHALITQQAADSAEKDRIDAELGVAKKIQHAMLPQNFEACSQKGGFSVYASMNAAKEVGGDLYDFFFVDDTHFAVLIGDVSGKGIPAALFMVIAKTMIHNFLKAGSTPEDAFTEANSRLMENNGEQMFVTAWLGLLDTQSGRLTYVNAGHNPPLICRKGGKYEFLHERSGFVLAGRKKMKYKQYDVNMDSGDGLLLYTDGITEAMNTENKLYGNDRLLDTVNSDGTLQPKELLDAISGSVAEFAGDAPQFDDMTMLGVKMKGEYKNITVKTKTENVAEIIALLEEETAKENVPPKAVSALSIAVDEFFSNVVKFSGSDEVTVGVCVEESRVSVRLCDNGVPYDPLSAEKPDVTLSAKERTPGGLGIFMVKKMTDSIEYERVGDMNVVTVRKNIPMEVK